MNIAEILSKDLMSFEIQGDSKKEVIENITDLLVQTGIVVNKSDYVASVMKRENEGTTGVGNGIAIPHGQSPAVTKSAVAFVKLGEKIDWHALDDKPVNLVFLLAIPEHSQSGDHLKVLSRLATRLMDDKVIRSLQESSTEEEIINAFKEGTD